VTGSWRSLTVRWSVLPPGQGWALHPSRRPGRERVPRRTRAGQAWSPRSRLPRASPHPLARLPPHALPVRRVWSGRCARSASDARLRRQTRYVPLARVRRGALAWSRPETSRGLNPRQQGCVLSARPHVRRDGCARAHARLRRLLACRILAPDASPRARPLLPSSPPLPPVLPRQRACAAAARPHPTRSSARTAPSLTHRRRTLLRCICGRPHAALGATASSACPPASACEHAGDRRPRWGDTRPPVACARMGIAVPSSVQSTAGVPRDAPMSGGRVIHRWVPAP
jgi:hypothetical protein